MIEVPKTIQITKIVKESPTIITLFFNHSTNYNPGQFVMLWLPGVDEKPFAISSISKKGISITIERKGEFTQRIFQLKNGDRLGIRGPYGKGFSIPNDIKNPAIIAGGMGIAPLSLLIERLRNPLIIQGAKSKEHLIFKDRFKNTKCCTDDGSFGFKGFATELFLEELKKGKIDYVYTCGPEIMMKRVMEICLEKGIKGEVSLERFMVCGFGVCAQCKCDDNLVCKDGPVFSFDKAKEFKELGKFAYSQSGKKVTLDEYYKPSLPSSMKTL